MSSALTLILWPAESRMHETLLFGRPLWRHTMDAARQLGPSRVFLVGENSGSRSGPAELARVSAKNLGSLLRSSRGSVLIVPAEVPCLRAGTLKQMARLGRSGVQGLVTTGTRGWILCGRAREIFSALDGQPGRSIEELAKRLPGTSVSADPEELLRVGTPAELAEAVQILRRRKAEELQARGVLLYDPSAVHIDPEVKIDRGARIHPWVVIEGQTRIAADCEIGSFSHIVDAVIGPGTVVLDHCFIRSSRIGRNVQIGPFAHLRPDSVVRADAKVGNFVELKKTVLGRGSKAPHLTYLGDAEVGGGVNVGAGTITCNYDGRQKHRTIIEDGAFIGSDVQLVAPVRVGRGAYVAAGSCIVEDVPAGSLALARARQVVKPGWAKKKTGKRERRGAGK